MSKYLEMVKADVLEAIRCGYAEELSAVANNEMERYDFEGKLYEDLWADDSVTGNASGSYYCNSYKTKKAVMADTETVTEALKEFCREASEVGEHFINEDWEWLDVKARCYVLSWAISEVLDELEVQRWQDLS